MRTLGTLALLALVAVPAAAADRVTIAVMGLFHPQQVAVEVAREPLLVTAGDHAFIIGEGGRRRVLLVRSGTRVALRSDGVHLATTQVTVAPRQGDAEFVLSVPGKLRRLYRGRLSILVDGAELTPVVEMELETAVASILAAEMPADTPIEALKAQAVVSRSYLVAGGPRHRHADFCDTTHCEFLRRPPAAASGAARAAAATQGLVLTWQAKPFAAMYGASCGGRTHTLAEIGYTPRDYPYFAVECPFCRRAPERWSSTLDAGDAAALHGDGARVKLGRKRGWDTVPSNTFTTEPAGDAVALSGVGRGHGVGLCQRGALGMALDGRNFREILAYYFPNTTLESLPSH